MHVTIPGQEHPLIINTLILDLNGTIAVDGKLIDGVAERIDMLRIKIDRMFLFTGDTQGNGRDIADQLKLELRITKNAEEKRNEALLLEPDTCAAIGNGKIDEVLFATVRFKIAVLEEECLHVDTLLTADVLARSIHSALDLLISEKRLIATLRC